MPTPRVAPYGSWKSPITTDSIVAETVNVKEVMVEGNDIYWIEQRPSEAGRSVIVRNGQDVTPSGFSARTRSHEYGGGSYFVADGVTYYSNDKDQRLYRDTMPLTQAIGVRFADGLLDRKNQRIIAIREDHRATGQEPINTLVSIPLSGSEAGDVLASGHDFYSSPRLSPNGEHLAWLTWDHPNMPWDGSDLWVDGQHIAGGPRESIYQPEWSPNGILYFVSDRSGWWNLYRWRDGRIEHILNLSREFGMPQWVFGMSSYAFLADGRIACSFVERGQWKLGIFDRTWRVLDLPYTEISNVHATADHIVCVAASPTEPRAVIQVNPDTWQVETLRRSTSLRIDPAYLSIAEPIEFPTEGGVTAHAFYYPPHNADFTPLPGELPPVIVMIHGGPTSMTTSGLNLPQQFWTSRGFGVVDVNYGGSTGFGRAYRERLNGQWGIVDVDDCVNAVRYLVAIGKADPNRLVIRGGSAGGYTTLSALTFRRTFRAGASYYGISDLEASNDTHKFESRYNYGLIAPWPAGRDIYHARSPLRHLDQLNCPVIFFQGLDDKIVLPNQSEMMVEAMKKKGLPVAYIAFEGEGHGFRQATTIKRTLDAELYFYSRVLNFPLELPAAPVVIHNL